MKAKINYLWYSFNIISVIFFFYLLTILDFKVVFGIIRQIPVYIWILIFILFLTLYILKAIRYHFLNPGLKFKDLLIISIYHNFFLMLLPFKMGEVVYIKKLKEKGTNISRSIAALGILRVLDILIILIFAVVINTTNKELGLVISPLLLPVLIILTLCFLLLDIPFLYKLIPKLHRFKNKYILRLIGYFQEIILCICEVKRSEKIMLITVTVLIWINSILIWVLILNLLLGLNPVTLALCVLIEIVVTALPINTPAAVGITQGGWILGLYLIGVSNKFALNFSVFAHGVYVIMVSIIFLLGLTAEKITRKQN